MCSVPSFFLRHGFIGRLGFNSWERGRISRVNSSSRFCHTNDWVLDIDHGHENYNHLVAFRLLPTEKRMDWTQ